MSQNTTRQSRTDALDTGDVIHICLPDPFDGTELSQERSLACGSQTGDPVQDGAGHTGRALLAVVGDGEAVGLVTQVLEQVEGRGRAREDDGELLSRHPR